jgi:hypothetical protein
MGGRFCLGHQQRMLLPRPSVVSSLGLVPLGRLRRRSLRRSLRRGWRMCDRLRRQRLHDLRPGRNARWARHDRPPSSACARTRPLWHRCTGDGRRWRAADGRGGVSVLYESRTARFSGREPAEHRTVTGYQTPPGNSLSARLCLAGREGHRPAGRSLPHSAFPGAAWEREHNGAWERG